MLTYEPSRIVTAPDRIYTAGFDAAKQKDTVIWRKSFPQANRDGFR